MSRAVELASQRKNTLAFIKANPLTLQLIPRSKVTDGGGSRWVKGNPRAPQTFRLIDQSTARIPTTVIVRTSDGQERVAEFMLLGEHDSTVELWDIWEDAGKTYEVAQLFPHNGYETRAAVVRLGA